MCKKGNGTIFKHCFEQASDGKPMSNKEVRDKIGKDGKCCTEETHDGK